MTDIFREVQEDVRQEQLTSLLKDHGVKIGAAIGALIVAYGAFNYWQSSQQQQAAAASDAFGAATELLQEKDAAGAVSSFAAIRADRGSNDYGLLAGFRQAEALLAQEKRGEAIGIYNGIASDSSVDGFLRDLATLYGASVLIDDGNSSGGIAKLEGLIEEDNLLKRSAMELKAYALFNTGKRDEARDIFTALQVETDDGTSFSSRAAQMLGELGSAEE